MLASRRLLLAQAHSGDGLAWGLDIETALHPAGVLVYRETSCGDAVRRVEEGGLSAAVVIEQQPVAGSPDVFALLRIIRSLDAVLPCWLVTRMTTRRALERALDLRVQSIIQYSSGVDELLAGLRKVLQDPTLEN
jgi:hypothetical protein